MVDKKVIDLLNKILLNQEYFKNKLLDFDSRLERVEKYQFDFKHGVKVYKIDKEHAENIIKTFDTRFNLNEKYVIHHFNSHREFFNEKLDLILNLNEHLMNKSFNDAENYKKSLIKDARGYDEYQFIIDNLIKQDKRLNKKDVNILKDFNEHKNGKDFQWIMTSDVSDGTKVISGTGRKKRLEKLYNFDYLDMDKYKNQIRYRMSLKKLKPLIKEYLANKNKIKVNR